MQSAEDAARAADLSRVTQASLACKRRLGTAPGTGGRSRIEEFEKQGHRGRLRGRVTYNNISPPHLRIEHLGRERRLRVVGRRLVAHGDVHQSGMNGGVR